MKLKKKWLALTLALALLVPGFSAFAQEAAPAEATVAETTALPFGLSFAMDFDTVRKALGTDASEEIWDDGTGCLLLLTGEAGLGEMKADSVSFQVDRNNSEKASRLSQIDMALPVGDDCIAAFRGALADLTTLYGQPDGDPFDAEAVQSYVEYGTLSATWTRADARINLSMGRMYEDSMNLDISNRLCYNAEDLK